MTSQSVVGLTHRTAIFGNPAVLRSPSNTTPSRLLSRCGKASRRTAIGSTLSATSFCMASEKFTSCDFSAKPLNVPLPVPLTQLRGLTAFDGSRRRTVRRTGRKVPSRANVGYGAPRPSVLSGGVSASGNPAPSTPLVRQAVDSGVTA